MIFRVVIETRAQDDIRDQVAWIRAHGSPLNAERWLDQLQANIRSLARLPLLAPLAPEARDLDLPVRQHLFKSHRIIFIVRDRTVHVLHVRHSSRHAMDQSDLGDQITP